jgi:transposase InsO family protein
MDTDQGNQQGNQRNSGATSPVENMLTEVFYQLVEMQRTNQAMVQALMQSGEERKKAGDAAHREGQYRLHTSTYSGLPNENPKTWLKQMEEGFIAERVLDGNRRVAYAASSLRGPALEWWSTVETFSSWNEFKQLLIAEFTPDNLQQLLRRKLQNLKQGRSILTYVTQFRDLIGQIENMTELDKVHFFVEGLRHKTKQELHYRSPTTVSDAVHIATKFETAQFGTEGTGSKSSHYFDQSRPREGNSSRPLRNHGGGRQSTFGPIPMELDALVRDRSAIKCFSCGNPGHIARNCQKKRHGVGQERNSVHDSGSKRSGTKKLNNLELLDSAFMSQIKAESEYLSFVSGYIKGVPVKFLVDTGATNNFIYMSEAKRIGVPIDVATIGSVKVGNNERVATLGVVKQQAFTIKNANFEVEDFHVLPGDREEIILGMPFIRKNLPWDVLLQSLGTKEESAETASSLPRISIIEGSLAEKELADDSNGIFLSIVKMNDELANLKTDLVGQDARNMLELVKQYSDVFPEKLTALPPERAVEHTIKLADDEPVYRSQYRLSPLESRTAKETVQELLEAGLIQPSKSPYSAPILFVKKTDGTLRMVLDYRILNKKTIRDRFPIPRISDLLDRLGNAKIFSKLDLMSGFFQVRVRQEDVYKTAFSTDDGHFEFRVMPMGMANSPATFQRLVRSLFPSRLDSFLVCYFDDICIFSGSVEEHMKHLKEVLQILRDNKLFAKLRKCEFGVKRVGFLGHSICAGFRSIDESKITAVQAMRAPTNIKEARRLVGIVNWLKDHIEGCADLIAPISDLTRKKKSFSWNEEHSIALSKIKAEILKNVQLKIPHRSGKWILQTDASTRAIGATLLQEQDNCDKPQLITFASRKLNDAEKRYPVHELEMLAIYWGIKHFRHYLEGEEVLVQTDHNSLKFVMTQPSLSRRMTRWIEYLQAFDLRIQYISGESNKFADYLSREATDLNSDKSDTKSASSLNLIVGREGPSPETDFTLKNVNTIDWPIYIVNMMKGEEEELPEGLKEFLEEQLPLFRYDEEKTLLYRMEGDSEVIYIPFIHRATLVEKYHIGSGHLPATQVIEKIRKRFWWPYMAKDVTTWLKNCKECQIFGNRTHRRFAEQVTTEPLQKPFSRWYIDYAGPYPESHNGNKYILVAIDESTRWPVARATNSMTAVNSAKILYEEVISVFGVPDEIVTDRGSAFISLIWDELLQLMNSKHKKTSAFHPRTNGKAENLVGSIHRMLAKACGAAIDCWDEFLHETLLNLRTRVHPATGKTPFYLVYGCEPKLPGDTTKPFCLKSESESSRVEARARILESLHQYRQAAAVRSGISANEAKLRYDKLVKTDPLRVGEWVLVRREFTIKTKLMPNWLGPFEVIQTYPSGVYKLRDPTGKVKNDLVHRDRMKRCHVDERPTTLWTNTQLEKFDDEDLILHAQSTGGSENNSLVCIDHAAITWKNPEDCQGVTSRGLSHGAPHG